MHATASLKHCFMACLNMQSAAPAPCTHTSDAGIVHSGHTAPKTLVVLPCL